MSTLITINGEDISSHTPMPIKWNALLDERLDEGRLSVRQVGNKLYPIGAQVKVEVGATTKDFILSADESTEVSVGSSIYSHELSLIEPTKLLEGVIVESLTFTNNLGRTYTRNPVKVVPIYFDVSAHDYIGQYMTPINGAFTISSWVDTLSEDLIKKIVIQVSNETPATIIIKPPFGEQTEYKITKRNDISPFEVSHEFTPVHYGIHQIVYDFYYWIGGPNGTLLHPSITIDLTVVPAYDALKKWNIRSVINRVLNLAEPHLQSVTPRYQLDPAQAAEFEKILAPEFAFTKCTLKEILDQIGGFIHGVPRLIRGESGELDTIHYGMLGGTDEALISSQNIRYISGIHSQNIEDYTTGLDSTVDNLVNTLDSDEGAVTEPYAGGFKSVRSEEAYARIEEGNMVISTTLPIYSVQKLEVIDTQNKVGDITAYVFEGAEYGRLSSFDGNYPTSKAYALYYNLGEKNIKGLNYKSPKVLQGKDGTYTITNIIKAVTGTNVEGSYPKLAFRITYTPIFSARILQHKPYGEPGALKRTLVYNQGANLVETRYYGENMKGVIARMGNPEFTRSYRMPDLTYVPKIGQIFKRDGEEYFISSVTVAVYPESVDFTVGMSKDFNRLSQYIGINSEWRAYEVSERKAYNRDMIYRDFCVIGDAPDINSIPLTVNGIFYISNIFAQTAQGAYANYIEPLTLAQVTTYDELGKPYPVTLPVVSTAFGNAMVFSFGMADNYSAGPQSVYDGSGNVTGYWQTDVPYVDYYGRVKGMEFKLAPAGKALNFGDEATFTLPQGDEYGKSAAPVSTPSNDRLVIDKNGSEILRVNYQLEFVSNWRDLIIGSALARNCLMVTSRQTDENGNAVHAAAVYVVNKKVGRFDSTIDLTSATKIYDYRDNAPSWSILQPLTVRLGDVTSTVAGVAWVIADQSNGDILLAQNMDIADGTVIHLPDLSLTHELP